MYTVTDKQNYRKWMRFRQKKIMEEDEDVVYEEQTIVQPKTKKINLRLSNNFTRRLTIY